MNTLQKIVASHYVATVAQVESLAHDHYTNSREARLADATYLRILVAGCQSKLGSSKRRGARPGAAAQLAVVESVHSQFYPAVMRGVTTEDIAPDETLEAAERSKRTLERNRRSTFARSAKATLVAFARGSGDIRVLDVANVSKGSLRAAVKPPEPVDRTERQISRAQGALLRALARQSRADPVAAQAHAEAIIELLQGALEEVPPAERQTQRTRVGTLVFNSPGVSPP